MNSDNLKFISNNVKRIQKLEKRIKIFEYLKNGFIFFQETHSSVSDEKRWCNELDGNLYFSHGKTNSCGVAIGYVGSKSFVLTNQTTDKNGRLLLIEVIFDDVKFVLINICNCNTESQQLLTLIELHKILQNVDDIRNKNIIIGGDLIIIIAINLIIAEGKGLWIFNSSLTLNKGFVEKMKEHIHLFKSS